MIHPDKQARASALFDQLSIVRTSSPPPSGIVYVASPDPTAPIAADGTTPDVVVTQRAAEQLCFELSQGSAPVGAIDQKVDSLAADHAQRGHVPIVVCHFRYASAHALFRALENADLAAGDAVPMPDAATMRGALEERTAFFACAPLPAVYDTYSRRPDVHEGLEVDFVLPADAFLSNVASKLSGIEIDFDDGRGARPIGSGAVVHVDYATAGSKVLKLVAECDGVKVRTQFQFFVSQSVNRPKPKQWQLDYEIKVGTFSALASGVAYVILGKGNTELKDPILVCDGFPGHSYEYLWDLVEAQGFASTVLAAGRDVILVSYTDGSTFIEANAGVLIACIQRALRERRGNRPLVVGGASMGGLVARFALAYMESQQMHEVAQVGTYFSFDSPHQGATIPLSIQFAVAFLASSMKPVAEFKKLLDSKASQELLLYYVNSSSTYLEGPSPLRGEFLSRLASVGNFPKVPQRLAVANGDGSGAKNYTPDDAQVFLNETFYFFGARLYSARGILSDDERLYCWVRTLETRTKKGRTSLDSPPAHIDSAPGGTNTFFKQLEVDDVERTIYNSACFVPTSSALAMALDLGKDVNLTRDLRHDPPPTPFAQPHAGYKFSEINTPHVAITPELRDWLLQQLGLPVPIGEGVVATTAVDFPHLHKAEALAITEAGRVYHSVFEADARVAYSWSPWSAHDFGLEGAPLAKSALLIPNHVKSNLVEWRVEAFLIGRDEKLYHAHYDGAWHGWSDGQGSGLWFPELAGELSAAYNVKAGRLELCMLTTNHHLYLNHSDTTGWSSWEAQDPTGLARVVLASNPNNGNVEVLGIATDGHLWHGYFDGTTYRGLRVASHGLTFSGSVRQVIAIPNNGLKHLELFLVDSNFRVFHNYYDGDWHGWSDTRDGVQSPDKPIVSVFGSENPVGQGVVVFAITDQGHLYENYYDGRWHNWVPDRAGLEIPARLTSGLAFPNRADGLHARVDAFTIGATSKALFRNDHQAGPTRHWWNGWSEWALPAQGRAGPR